MTAPAPTRAEEGRYTVVYEGDPAGNRILNGEPAVGRAVGVMLGDLIERAAQAEAEVARLTQERDEALCLAEGPSTLLDLARGSVSRGMELHAAEAEVARLTAALKVSDKKAREVMLACLRAFRTSVMNDNTMPFSAFCTLVDDRMCEAARTALEAPRDDGR